MQMNIDEELCPDNYVGYISVNENCDNLNVSCSKRLKFKNRNSISESDIKQYKSGGNKIIVLVLESPHKDEYEKLSGNGIIAPALGTTGERIQKCLKCILAEPGILEKNTIYHIILMNAIQYGCSCGIDTKKYRDKNFCNKWFKPFNDEKLTGKEDFILRLKAYEPNFVINTCTQGKHYSDDGLKRECIPGKKYLINEIKIQNIDTVYRDVSNLDYPFKWNLQSYVQEAIFNFVDENSDIKCYYSIHPCRWSENTELKEIKFSGEDS